MRHYLMFVTVIVIGSIFLLAAAIFGYLRSYEAEEHDATFRVLNQENYHGFTS
jgi:hypothetical protein